MKFSSFFLFSSMAFAAPQLTPRQQTVVGTVADAVNTLEDATSKNFAEIRKAVDSVEDNISAEIEATLRANYEAILAAFEDATEAIVDVTTDAAGNVVGNLQNLGRQQIRQLAEALRAAQRIIEGLEATIELTVTDLGPEAERLLKEEIDAVEEAIEPFVKPLARFAEAARRANASLGVTVNGLRNALDELLNVVENIVDSLGLGDILNLGGLLGGKKGPKL